jgi:hypothetical protein
MRPLQREHFITYRLSVCLMEVAVDFLLSPLLHGAYHCLMILQRTD